MQPKHLFKALTITFALTIGAGCAPEGPVPTSPPTSPTRTTGGQPPTVESGPNETVAVANELDVKYISADFTGAVVFHPHRFLSSEFVKANEATGFPVLKGAEMGIKQSGIDPRSVAQVMLLVDEQTMMEASQFVPMMLRPMWSFPEPSTTTGGGDRPEEAPDPDLPEGEVDGEPANPGGQGAITLAESTLQPVNFQPQLQPPSTEEFEPPSTENVAEGEAEHGEGHGHGGPGMMGEPPIPTLIVRFMEPIDPETFFDDKPFPPMEDAEVDGLKIKKTPAPMKGPILHFPDNQTLILTKPELLKKMVVAKSVNSPLVNELRQVDASNDIVLVIDVTPLRPMLETLTPLLAAEGSPQGPIARELLTQLKILTMTAGLSNDTLLSVSLVGESAEMMTKFNDLLSDIAERYREGYQQLKKEALSEENPMMQEFKREDVKMMEAMSDEMINGTTNIAEGPRLTVTIPKPKNFDNLPSVMQPIIEKTLGSAKDAEILMKKKNHLKMIGLGFHNYHSVYNSFPGAGSDHTGEKKGLSWRVHLLPYLDHAALYEQFHLDEPWDSEHNKKLISQMPDWFKTPEVTEEGKTAFQVFVGNGAAFEGEKGLKIRDFTDGLSNILLVIETSPESAEFWTKPGGIPFDEKKLLDAFQTPYRYGFLFLMADGTVHQSPDLAENLGLFKKLITRNDGEVIDFKQLD